MAIAAPEGTKRRPLIRAERACSRVKQANDLDYFTVPTTSSLPIPPGCHIFHQSFAGGTPINNRQRISGKLRRKFMSVPGLRRPLR